MKNRKIIIGSRGSKLALIYAEKAREKILNHSKDFGIEEVIIKEIVTKGDQVQDKRLSEVGGKGLFSKTIEVELLEKKNFKVSLPIIKKENQMNFYSWSRNDPLKINKFGIPEPVSSKIFYPDILLVPLVAYDSSLNRLGYGGGYYDRFIEKIEKIKKVTKIGLAFSFQKISSIPINQYDKKLDFIVTEKEILQ